MFYNLLRNMKEILFTMLRRWIEVERVAGLVK